VGSPVAYRGAVTYRLISAFRHGLRRQKNLPTGNVNAVVQRHLLALVALNRSFVQALRRAACHTYR